MSEKTKTGTQERSSQPTADTSDAHVALSDELTIVVGHMKKSNEFVKVTNKELIKLNRVVARQNQLLWWLVFGLLVLLGSIGFSLGQLHEFSLRFDAQLVQQTSTNKKLTDVVEKLIEVGKKTKETKDAIDEQPKITVKPADTSDPTSKPVLIVQPGSKQIDKSKGHKKSDLLPHTLKGVEIPFDQEKLDKKK